MDVVWGIRRIYSIAREGVPGEGGCRDCAPFEAGGFFLSAHAHAHTTVFWAPKGSKLTCFLKRSQEAPKRSPRGAQEDPRGPQEVPRGPQEVPKRAPRDPTRAPRGSKSSPRGPKTPPRGPKRPPRGRQEAARRLPRGTGEAPDAPETPQRLPKTCWCHFCGKTEVLGRSWGAKSVFKVICFYTKTR